MHKNEFFIKKCIDLATKGAGNVSPNPMVGCVIVYKNNIIGEGFHEKFGLKHAEVNAIESVTKKELLEKSTLYVNLEPCAHYGKTPPCCNMIIEYKIPRVVIGCVDSFSKVAGKGITKMKNAGIEVIVGVLKSESRELNKRFFTYHEKKRPYIILKWAESEDGFIAPKDQREPFWMTSNKSKKIVHKWRANEDSILIGRVTAEKDNPLLTVRMIEGKNPIRIVIDKKLRLSEDLNIFNSESETIIFNALKSEKKYSNNFIKINYKSLINNILKELHKQNIQSIIIEGGRETLQSFINTNLWDEARLFTTDKKIKNGIKAPIIDGRISCIDKIDEDLLKTIIND